MERTRTVLLVGLPSEIGGPLAHSLLNEGFALESVGFEEGFELVELVPFDAVVAAFPFPREVPMTRFTTRLRKHSSACRHAALVLLADEHWREEAEGLGGRGVNAVFSRAVPAGELAAVLRNITCTAPRVPLVAMVHLEVSTEGGSRRLVAQCENLSTSGMFVRMAQVVPLGATVAFELVLPDEGYRLRGRGTVVRHGAGSRRGQEGIAIRLGELAEEGWERLRAFVGRRAQGSA